MISVVLQFPISPLKESIVPRQDLDRIPNCVGVIGKRIQKCKEHIS